MEVLAAGRTIRAAEYAVVTDDGRKCPSKEWIFHEKYGCILHREVKKITWIEAMIECSSLADKARLAEIHEKDFGLWLASKFGKDHPWNRPGTVLK